MPVLSTASVSFASLAGLVPAHPGNVWGPGPWILAFPLFWLLAVTAVVLLASRRRRGWGPGPWGWHPADPAGGRSARDVLADRFARGEIDEAEYRARLEVLLAGAPRDA